MVQIFAGMLIVGLLVPGAAQEPSSPDIRRLIEQLSSDDVGERDRAIRRLKDIGTPAKPELERAARGDNLEGAARSREILKVLAVSEILTPRLMRTFPGVEERLGLGAEKAWTELLMEALEWDHGRYRHPFLTRKDLEALVGPAFRGVGTDSKLKIELCYAVRSRGLDAAIPQLLAYLRQDGDENVRGTSGAALGHLGATEAVPDLLKHLAADGLPQFSMRQTAGWALAGLDAKEAIPTLIHILRVGERYDRLVAIQCLGQLDARDAIPDLKKLLTSHVDSDRCLSAYVLGRLGASAESARIASLLGDADAQVRWNAATALGLLKAREESPNLMPLLQDPEHPVRAAAASALGRIGNKEVVPELLKLLNDSETDVHCCAARALARLGARDAAATLAEQLRDPAAVVRSLAVQTLARLQERTAVPSIVRLLEDPDDDVRIDAAAALCALGSDAGVPLLLKDPRHLTSLNALRDPERWKRLGVPSSRHFWKGTAREIAGRIVQESGLALLDLPASIVADRFWMTAPTTIDGEETLAGDFLHCLGSDYGFILEATGVRLVPREEEAAFWQAWWTSLQKNK